MLITDFLQEIIALLKDEYQKNVEKSKMSREIQLGENDSYICKLIRDDSIEEFIIFVNQGNISLASSKIKYSICETNTFLMNNEPTLIEYAVFFGSIQIFQYLILNGVGLRPSLWLYAIHGRNSEIIYILEENDVKPPGNTYKECILESIK